MINKLVSVIIPCYNCELYVEQAVRSIMNQTYRNLEILVINDGSSDRTKEILLNLSSEDHRILYIENTQNLKLIATLNKGLKLANGEYIARMDSDDVSFPIRIEKQVDFLEKHPDVAVLGTNAWSIDGNDSVIGHSLMPESDESIRYFANFASPFIHPSILLRAASIKNIWYDVDYIHAEDFKLWLDILKDCKGFNLKDRLIAYRYNVNSVSHCFSDIQQENASKLIKPDSQFLDIIPKLSNYQERVPLYAKIIKKNIFNIDKYLSVKTFLVFLPSLLFYCVYKIKYYHIRMVRINIYKYLNK